jgi:hypothetical protein
MMGIELWYLYSCRCRLCHHNAAGKRNYPTIHTPDVQIRAPPTRLLLPKRLMEREGTNGLAGIKAWATGFLPFRLCLL